MTLNVLTTEGMKVLRGFLLLLLIVLTPFALGVFGEKAEASSDAPAHEAAPAHDVGQAVESALAEEPGLGHEAVVSHEAPAHGEEAAHGDAGHGEEVAHGGGHHAKPPLIYYANWFVLFLGVIMCGLYLILVVKVGKPHHETIFLAFIFVCMAYFLFISANYLPSMARHFDMKTLTFVDGYHESPFIGFVKFIYRMIFGYFLMVYAIVGMEHH